MSRRDKVMINLYMCVGMVLFSERLLSYIWIICTSSKTQILKTQFKHKLPEYTIYESQTS